MTTTVDYDDVQDVLYVRDESYLDNAHSARLGASESVFDAYFVTHLDAEGVTRRVTFIGAGELTQHDWIEHPERSPLPKQLRIAIDDWYAAKQKRESK